jgi:hypothetical protein
MACLLKVIPSGKQLEGGEALPKRAPKYKLSMRLHTRDTQISAI